VAVAAPVGVVENGSRTQAPALSAWQAGAISRDTMTDLFRRGEVLPEGATAEDERGASVPSGKPQLHAPAVKV